MGRPERVIDPADGPLAAFAFDLVALRKAASGKPTLRELETRSGYSKAALSQACSGRALPTLDLTLAYVGACGADMTAWETRWRELAALLRATHPELIPSEDGEEAVHAEVVRSLSRTDPRRLGPYTLLGVLGAGASGRVYLAKDAAGSPLAIKAIRPEYADSQAFRARFRQELQAVREVSTACGVPIVDADADDEQPWMATACIAGPSLEQAVSEHGPLPEPCVRVLGARLAEALADLHRAGIVHRDLKPGNVLLDASGPRLIDFGVAHIAAAPRLTVAGARLGTPAFIAPEQVTGDPVGPATDVFALGALLAFAAGGTPPFGDGSPEALFTRVVHTDPDLDNVVHLGADLRELIAACLNKNPGDRPDTDRVIQVCEQPETEEPWLPAELATVAKAREAAITAALTADPGRSESARTTRFPQRGSLAVPLVIAAVIVSAVLLARPNGDLPQSQPPDTVPGPGISSDDTTPNPTPTGPSADSSDAGSPAKTVTGGSLAGQVADGSPSSAVPAPHSSPTGSMSVGSSTTATTTASAPPPTAGSPAPPPPAVPQNLRLMARRSFNNDVLFSATLDDPTADADSFDLQINGTNIVNVPGTARSHMWTVYSPTVNAVEACVLIRAVNAVGTSDWDPDPAVSPNGVCAWVPTRPSPTPTRTRWGVP